MSQDEKTAPNDISAAEKAPKDKGERFAEDLVYTLNHAIVCATSDVIDPFIGAYTQKVLGRRLVLNPLHDWAHNKFEHHDHGHDHHHHHDHHGHDHHHHDHHHHHGCGHTHPTGGTFWGNLGHWVIGEAVGDVGAVPFTLGMQYYAPGVMRGIQYAAEPVLGGAFRWSAGRFARSWGDEHGFDADSPEVKARAEELYQHEVTHLPHAFMWTGSAAGLNILTQKFVTRNKAPTTHLIAGKALGSIGTLALVLGLRTLAPGTVQRLDEWNTENLAEPITRRVSRWVGVDSDTVERVLDREREFGDGHHILAHAADAKAEQGESSPDREAPEQKVQARSSRLLAPFSLTRAIG